MEDDDKFCTRCGKSQEEEQTPRASADEGGHASGWMPPPPPMSTPQWQYTSPQDFKNRYGAGTKNESGMNAARIAIIAAACLFAAVLGVVLFIKLRPARDDSGDSGDNTYAYHNQETDGGENYGQGQQTPSSGQMVSNTPAASGAGGNTEVTVHSGQDQAAAVTSEQDDYQTGWVTDEEGNEVYYPSEGEEYTGNDQTGNGVQEQSAEVSVPAQTEPQPSQPAEASQPLQPAEPAQPSQPAEASRPPQPSEPSEPSELAGANMAGDNSYILSESSNRYYTREELNALSDYDLQMAINEIYARHGRKFDTESIRKYFEGKSWYKGTISPADFDKNESSYFNKYEKANKDLMAKIRAEREKATGKTIKWE